MWVCVLHVEIMKCHLCTWWPACVGSHDRMLRAFMHTKDRLHTLVRQSYTLDFIGS